MAASHVYHGLPIVENGVVVAVQRVRGIEAADGKVYHGVLDTDARGNEFTYNRVPDTYSPIAPVLFALLDANGNVLLDSDGKVLMVRG